MIAMHLIDPNGRHKSYRVRFKNHDGRVVKVGGFRDRARTHRLGERIRVLVNAKVNGDVPPRELSGWIESMEPKLANKLVAIGLLDRRRFEQSKPIGEHIDAYRKAVAARKNNTAEHAKRMAANVARVCNTLNIEYFDELDENDVLVAVNDWGIASATVRHYLVSCCDFCKWMVRTKRASANPMPNTPKPSPDQDEQHVRRPLTVDEFKALMAYLDTFELYPGQKARWTAYDRKVLYWTAVLTGFRKSELESLRRYQLFLSDQPATIDIKATDAKNRTAASVPIPEDLAAALREYTSTLHPASRVFWFPSSRHCVIDMFRRDLEGAGIEHTWQTGEVADFHALRSTCITWWLDEFGLSPKKVQVLARLKTLSLVSRYSRKFRLDSYGWLDQAPKLNESDTKTGQGNQADRS